MQTILICILSLLITMVLLSISFVIYGMFELLAKVLCEIKGLDWDGDNETDAD